MLILISVKLRIKSLARLVLYGMLFTNVYLFPKMRIVLTAALTDYYYEIRKNQYIESLKILARYGYNDIYIIEAIKQNGPTFLDDFSKNVFYSTVNDFTLKPFNGGLAVNQGINEARTMLEGLRFFNFDSNDMIVKVNGRAQFASDHFFKELQKWPNVNCFLKKGGLQRGCAGVLLCYAMKYKDLIDWLENIDYNGMYINNTILEAEFVKYLNQRLKKGNFEVATIDFLDMKYNILGSTTCPGRDEKITMY